MKLPVTILLLCVTLLTAGCGIVRKSSQSPVSQHAEFVQGESHVEVRRERYSSAVNDSERRHAVCVDERINPVIRPSIRFSGVETEHVRLSTIDYFPTGGIDLSLDEMCREFCYPLRGKLISDYGVRSGRMHTGIDIKAMPNDTIRAAFAGVVRMSKNYSGYGNIVVIRHYQGFETAYSHNSKNLVKPNDTVEAGDPIALAGRTGRATTEHLHFEVRAGGDHFDPKLMVDPQAMALRSGKLVIRNHNGKVIASTTESDNMRKGEEAFAAQAEYETARAEAIAQSTVNGSPKGSAAPEPVYYRVKKNDTLSAIARKHGTTVKKLCQLNNINEASYLQINQRLRVK